jgi:TolB-like protein
MAEQSESENHQGPAGEAAATAPRVFISYASHDATIAQKVCAALEAAGTPCWIAPRDVVPGTLYADGIVGAIDESSVFVLILSEQAVASAHVSRELERAVSKRHPIIALKTDAAPLTRAFEYFLNQSQWIDVGALGIETAAAKLVKAVGRHLNPSADVNPTHLPDKSGASYDTAVPRTKWIVVGVVAIASLALAYFAVNHLWKPTHGTSAPVSDAVLGRPNGAAEKVDTAMPASPAASVAVLAFSDLSADGSQSYFSDGMAEEILNVLAHVKGLKVASRTSSFRFRKSDLGAPAIAAKLGVRHILEGSVRKAGDTVRITVQLIDASTDEHEWSQTFDRPLSTANLFAIQDEIANTIVEHLAAMIGSAADVAKPAARKADTADADAYSLT